MADGETPNPQNGEEDPPVRRSLGRRKGSETKKKKKKKVPQRGMGMEKLERHRIQQEWNKINHHPINILQPFMGSPNSDLHFGITHSPHFLGGELSSTPNSLSCTYRHCNACHKKKKVSNSRNLGSEVGECGFVGMNFRENQNNFIISKEEDDVALANSAANKCGGEMNRKLGSSSVMEYDFFPHKADDHEDFVGMFTTCSSSPREKCVYLDLSLKL